MYKYPSINGGGRKGGREGLRTIAEHMNGNVKTGFSFLCCGDGTRVIGKLA